MDRHGTRQATVQDADVLGRLLFDFNTEFNSPTDPAEVLSARFERIMVGDSVIALLAGDADGFALITLRPAIWFDGPVAQLEELYVVPELRDHGIGTELIRLARRLVSDRGAPEMHINVDAVDAATRRFYERHGFTNIENPSDGQMLCYIGPTEVGVSHSRSEA